VHLHPNREKEILQCAEQVARNREVAGVNYPSDTEAGRKLAQDILHLLTSECELFRATLKEAAAENHASTEALAYSQVRRVAEHLTKGSESFPGGRTS